MIRVSKLERLALDKAGALQYKVKEKGGHVTDGNFVTTNKCHVGRSKHHYVTETPEVLAFLNRWSELDLQTITNEQLTKIKEADLVDADMIQNAGSVVEGATVFIDSKGTIRCKKITSYMKAAGIWS